jgi:CheY-like chemotaxis protein
LVAAGAAKKIGQLLVQRTWHAPVLVHNPFRMRNYFPYLEWNVREMLSMKLLVVDDEPGVRKSIQIIAGTLGWEALACDQFGDVVQLVREHAVDILVCDYRMPPITGFHIVRQLREAELQLPVVMITANPEIIDRGVARQLGISKLIGKPANVWDVRQILVEAVGDAEPAGELSTESY